MIPTASLKIIPEFFAMHIDDYTHLAPQPDCALAMIIAGANAFQLPSDRGVYNPRYGANEMIS
jgi:hypothetical protein